MNPSVNLLRTMAGWLLAVWLARTVAALAGEVFEISGANCRFPDVAYGSGCGRHLAVWADYIDQRIYGRFVLNSGRASSGAFPISSAAARAYYPAVAYNATHQEFLVTWDDEGRGDVIHGQRINATNGQLAGVNFAIGSVAGGIRSAVAWSAVSNLFLVVYFLPGTNGEVYGQWVSASGGLVSTNFPVSTNKEFAGYPAVSWGATSNEFLVTWDSWNGNIYGQRVSARTGRRIGPQLFLTSEGGKDRSASAYDAVNRRWLVQFNDGSHPGYSYDQYGQFVQADGSLVGGIFPIANTTGFEGDTQLGGDLTFVPIARRFFGSFGTDTGMGGQEMDPAGVPRGGQVVLGTGYFTSLSNAGDTDANRFLTVWEGMAAGVFSIYGQLHAATLSPVTQLTATNGNATITLTWRNPTEAHFTGTRVCVKPQGYPVSPDDGTMILERTGAPGAIESLTLTNLANWTPYYLAVFAHDAGTNYAPAVLVAATPRPRGRLVSQSEFTTGTDGWLLNTWAAGALAPGTIRWDATAGAVVATGSGASNNRDACTREGASMIRGFSTVGCSNVQLEFDAMAALHTPPTGSPAGTCAVLENSLEDKLVLGVSMAGTNGPWTIVALLTEGIEWPAPWTRHRVNLSGVPGVADNPQFALRFQWQFNNSSDTGAVDNVQVLSEAITGSAPAIGVSPLLIERVTQAGANPAEASLLVENTGAGVLHCTVRANVPWLNPQPPSVTSAGPALAVALKWTTAALAPGEYEGALEIASTNAAHAPQTVAIRLRVLPAACVHESFDYYNGPLPLMGGPPWTGTVTNAWLVENRALKTVGGSGAFEAVRAAACAAVNGWLTANLKVRAGVGTGQFFWNCSLEDASSNTLARWYGGSTIVRGRIGGTVTADLPLTGPTVWDDLFVKINTVARTTEFFFNGTSCGVIAHGAATTNLLGRIRLERLDRVGVSGETIWFDDWRIGVNLTMPPKLRGARGDQGLRLTWPAVGEGFLLESALTLGTAMTWMRPAQPVTVLEGLATCTVPWDNPRQFFRLRNAP